MVRYLRILVVTLSLTACFLIAVLWVRSYSGDDTIHGPVSWLGGIIIRSHSGRLIYELHKSLSFDGWTIQLNQNDWWIQWVYSNQQWGWSTDPKLDVGIVPHWLPVLLSFVLGMSASLPWLRWRFTLRTLLLLMTFAAVVLVVFAILA
jgi:hypothetical protein